MSPRIKEFYQFENFSLSIAEKSLYRDGLPIPLPPKAFETLLVLIENAGHLLEKDELMEKIWQDRFVEEGNLAFNIKVLRKALGDNATNPRFIETVPRRGYRFIAEVKKAVQEPTADPPQLTKRGRSNVFLPAAATLLILLFVGLWYARTKATASNAPVLSTPFSSENLSTNGKVRHAVISPDGKNVVYVSGVHGERQSVWLRQLETSNNVEIIPPSENDYDGLQISPDNNFVYFARRTQNSNEPRSIFRVSIVGGVPQKVVVDTEGYMSLSPDGTLISFIRCEKRPAETCSLWIADSLNGRNERKLATRPWPEWIGDNAFSPDGKIIAFAAGQTQNKATGFGLFEIEIDSGKEREISAQKFFNIKHLAWLPEGRRLLFTASQLSTKHYRIWQLSLSDGTAEPVTNDSASYLELSIDKSATLLIATQNKQDFGLSVVNPGTDSTPRVLADASRATYAPDGKIFFSSVMSGNDEIWSIAPDGSEQKQLTNQLADDVAPVVSPDNKLIFFASNRTGEVQVWRMNIDGSDQVQMTNKGGGYPLFASPDGKWLYYEHALDKTLWRVSLADGGEEVVLNLRTHHFAISPDASKAAFLNDRTIEIVALDDGRTQQSFGFPDQRFALRDLAWTSDGSGVTFVSADPDETFYLRVQPMDGGPVQKIADLGNGVINSFAVAPDGKSFAVVSGGWRHDAVLLKGLK